MPEKKEPSLSGQRLIDPMISPMTDPIDQLGRAS
jgi:hypothetical protein